MAERHKVAHMEGVRRGVKTNVESGLAVIEHIPDFFLVGDLGDQAAGYKFSNFWFRLFTLVDLGDTQSGFRLYPLGAMEKMRFFTPRYEFEVEVAVRLAWKG